MRVKKFVCLVLALFFTVSSFAKKDVDLKGEWKQKGRSVNSLQPIKAWVEDNNKDLLLEFSANLGMVEVTVRNHYGEIICNQLVEAVEMASIIIPLHEAIQIGYSVSITDGENLVYGVVEY